MRDNHIGYGRPRKDRDIRFVRPGPIFISLNIPPTRCRELSRFVEERFRKKMSFAQIVHELNTKEKTTDAEWTACLFVLGQMSERAHHMKEEE